MDLVISAAAEGNLALLQSLIEQKFPVRSSALTAAISAGHVDVIKYLMSLKHGENLFDFRRQITAEMPTDILELVCIHSSRYERLIREIRNKTPKPDPIWRLTSNIAYDIAYYRGVEEAERLWQQGTEMEWSFGGFYPKNYDQDRMIAALKWMQTKQPRNDIYECILFKVLLEHSDPSHEVRLLEAFIDAGITSVDKIRGGIWQDLIALSFP